MNVPGKISNPYSLKNVTLYPSVRFDKEQQWYGGRYYRGVPRGALGSGAGISFGDGCLNTTHAYKNWPVTVYKCIPGDSLQQFYGKLIIGTPSNTSRKHLIQLGNGDTSRSLCLEPDMSRGYFYPNMRVELHRCNPNNTNQWFDLTNWG